MNAIGMLFQQVQMPADSSGSLKQTKENDKSSLFQSLLDSEQSVDAPMMQHVLHTKDSSSNRSDGKSTNMDGLPTEMKELLYNMIIGSEEVDSKEMILEQFIDSSTKPLPMSEDLPVIQKELAGIVATVETLLSQVENKQDIKKAAPKILDLLHQWTTLAKRSGDNESRILSSTKNNEGTKEQAIWRELVQSFQKRDQLASKQQYNSDAKVTSADVAKWISNAMGNQSTSDRPFVQQTSTTTMPVTRLEQYVIHVNQTQSASQSIDKQLIEQFQKIMQSSKFSAMPNGTNQLSITVRPENLGEMMVRLTQVNGEMTAKILVSSQAAKEMLESNIGQLRNMFSPAQVVIEKQELAAQQDQEMTSDEKEQELTDQEKNQSQDSDQKDEQHSGDDFETQFQELLMNEKV